MTQTHADVVQMVLSVLQDGRRSDRYLRVSGDGEYYTTPDRDYLTPDGRRETLPCVEIPVAQDTTSEEEEAWAEELIRELDGVAGR